MRWLATAALTLGLSAAAACSPDVAGPVAPSPGPVGSPTTRATQPGQTSSTTPGPGATRPGIRMNVAARPDGSFDITEDVMLPRATNILQVQLPVR